jgi:hypothetical protein
MAQEKHSEFEVKDRRRFTAEGEAKGGVEPGQRAGAAAQRAASPPPPPLPPQQRPGEPQPAASDQQTARSYVEGGRDYDPPTFHSLVLAYYQTAILQMGLVAADPQHPPECDIVGARETIDMLGLLQEKTRGNLTAEESRRLDSLLYELRMAWVEFNRLNRPES